MEIPSQSSINNDSRRVDEQTSNLMVLHHTESFLRKHNWKLFQITAFSFGFLIFFIYFCQNKFYPDFDLFGFASLLVAASLLGGVILAFVSVGFCLPGLFWFYTFFQEPITRTHFDNKIADGYPADKLQHRLITSYFFIPCTVSLAAMYISVFASKTAPGYTTGIVVAPLLIGVLWGVRLKKEYNLPKWSALKFSITALITFLLLNIISLLLVIAAKDLLSEQSNILGDHFFSGLLLVALGITFTAIARIIQISVTHAIIAGSLLSAILLAPQVFNKLPGGIIKRLGIGNYDVESILLTSDACESFRKIKAYKIGEECQINSAHVIWSMGDTYYFTWVVDNQKTFSIRTDKQSIQSIERK